MAKIFVTCKYCKKKIDKAVAYSDKPRSYYCNEDCFNKYNDDHKPKRQCYACGKMHEEKDMSKVITHWVCNSCYPKFIKTDEYQLEALLDYVWKLYSESMRNPTYFQMLKKQAIHYHDEYDFKYKGMLLAIKYWVEVLENIWQDQYGLGQALPKAYVLAKKHNEQQQQIKQSLQGVNINKESRVVVTAKPHVIARPLLDFDD